MIVDTHTHISKSAARSHDLAPMNSFEVIEELFFERQEMDAADEFMSQMRETGIEKILLVTPSSMGFDNSYSLEVAARYIDRLRVVVLLPVDRDADTAAQIATLRANPLVVGIRLMILDGSAEGIEHRLARTFSTAEELNMPTCVYFPCAPEVVLNVARQWPDLPMVVDHAGLNVLAKTDPSQRLAAWPNVLRLIDHPRVFLKVSALPELAPEDEVYPFPTAQGLLQSLVHEFGSERLMWGSNYPPISRRCTLSESLSWMVNECSFLSADEREDLFHRTASRFFELPWEVSTNDPGPISSSGEDS